MVWGGGAVFRVSLGRGKVERLAAEGDFAAAGCLVSRGLVLSEGDKLVLHSGRRLETRTVIDQGGEMADCLEADLLGHPGILVTWRGLQVRHYRPPEQPEARWPYREIYSFYTASYQAGLMLRDVDGDGRPDIFCGNYWIRSPEQYDLPWRLFAINTYNEEPLSARMKLALVTRPGVGFPLLAVAQGSLAAGRIAVFEKPADATQLWKERRLSAMNRPNGPAAASGDFVAGGALWRQTAAGEFLREDVPGAERALALWMMDVNKDGRADIVTLEPGAVTWYERGAAGANLKD